LVEQKQTKLGGKEKEDEDGFEKVGYTRRDLLHNVGGKRLDDSDDDDDEERVSKCLSDRPVCRPHASRQGTFSIRRVLGGWDLE
jgi:hypothetical protein